MPATSAGMTAKKRLDLTGLRHRDHSQELFPELVRHGGDHPLKSAGESSGNDNERQDSEHREGHRPERSGYFFKRRHATLDQLEKNPGQNRNERQSNKDLP